MGRNLHYIADYRDESTGHRKRIWVIPSGATILSRDDMPEWGATPTGIWTTFPVAAFKGVSDGDIGYDKLPIGIPDPPTRTFRFDLDLLTGSTDIEDLATYIVDPVYTDGGVIWVLDASGRAFDTRTVHILLTDIGDEASAIGAFVPEFVGVQVSQTETEISHKTTSGETIVEVQAVHVVAACMQEVVSDDIAQNVLGDGYSSRTSTMIYDVLIDLGSGEVARVLGSPPTDSNRQVFTFYSIRALWSALKQTCESALRSLLRSEDVTWEWGVSGTQLAGSHDLITFHQQDYTADGERSATQVGEPHFIGKIAMSGDPGTIVGGMCFDGEDFGFHRFATAKDLLKALAGHCRATLALPSVGEVGSVEIVFVGIRGGESSDIVTSDLAGVERTLTVRGGVVAGTEGEVPGARDGDRRTVSVRIWGTDEDESRGVDSLFSVSPCVGKRSDFYEFLGASGFNSELTGSVVIMGSYDPYPNGLVYFSTLSFTSGDIAIRCHHDVGLDDGVGVQYDCVAAQTDPWPVSGDIEDDIWPAWRLGMLELQGAGGITFAACARIAAVFSAWSQWQMESSVQYELALPHHLGGVVDDIASGNDLLVNGGAYLGTLPGSPVITKIAPKAGALADITLIAPGGS